MNRNLLFYGFFLVSIVVLAGRASSQVSVEDEDISREEMQEVLQALETADMPAEYSPFDTQPSSGYLAEIAAGLQWNFHGTVKQENEIRTSSRFKGSFGPLSFRGKWLKNSNDQRMLTGAVTAKFGQVIIQAGGLGMSMGYGLLVHRPGRSGGLAAANSMPNERNQISPWSSSAEKNSVRGLGFNWIGNSWGMSYLEGKSYGEHHGTRFRGFQFKKHYGPCSFASGYIMQTGMQGGSINGKLTNNRSSLGFEWAGWKTDKDEVLRAAWLVSIRSRLPAGIDFQWQNAGSNGGAPTLMALRPGVLSGWLGSGWALRLAIPLVSGLKIKSLVAGNTNSQMKSEHKVNERRLLDLEVSVPLKFDWKARGRWNHRINESAGWSESFPWLPPSIIKTETRSVLAVDFKREQKSESLDIMFRSLVRSGSTSDGRRSLAGVRFKKMWFSKIRALVAYQWAWGDPVDLVSAISPLSGLVLPRHWGHWSSEILLAGRLNTPLGRFTLACSRRVATASAEKTNEITIWAGCRGSWSKY